jgi:micrococcal nuclease
LRVIDGDTIVARIDLGFRMTTEQSLRLLGINTPELRSPDPEIRRRAVEARNRVEAWIAEQQGTLQWPLLVATAKGDSFGRWLADVRSVSTGESLNEGLLREGFAIPFP